MHFFCLVDSLYICICIYIIIYYLLCFSISHFLILPFNRYYLERQWNIANPAVAYTQLYWGSTKSPTLDCLGHCVLRPILLYTSFATFHLWRRRWRVTSHRGIFARAVVVQLNVKYDKFILIGCRWTKLVHFMLSYQILYVHMYMCTIHLCVGVRVCCTQ